MDKGTLRLAAQLVRKYEQQHREYRDMVAEYARKGYGAPHCEHGTNLWVAWDNICGHCENGETFADPMQRRRAALAEARHRMQRVNALVDLRVKAILLGVPMDERWIADEIGRLYTVK